MLTQQQIVQFQTFGFLVLRDVFSKAELKTIDTEFTRKMESAYGHAPFDGTKRYWVTMMGSDTPFFTGLTEAPRFHAVAQQLYGEDVLGIISDANRYVGSTRWHSDSGSDHQYGVKFAYYLQPVGANSGALRVIPGSHKNPLRQELRDIGLLGSPDSPFLKEAGLNISDIPAFVCDSEPGDVVAFDLRLWHSSWGGSDDRRMCTIVYYNNPKTPEEEEATRKIATAIADTPARYHRPNDPHFDPDWGKNAGGSPTRQRWLDRMRELDFSF